MDPFAFVAHLGIKAPFDRFTAPEIAREIMADYASNPFQKDFEAATKAKFPDANRDMWLLAFSVLVTNKRAFHDRMQGVIVDSWLEDEKFPIIAQACVDLLDIKATFCPLEDYQVKLRDFFKNMVVASAVRTGYTDAYSTRFD